MRVHDERRHVQRAEVERGRRHFAADAGQLLQPFKRLVHAAMREKRKIEIRLKCRYGGKRLAKMQRLDVGKCHLADHRLNVVDRCFCKRGPSRINPDEPLISVPRNLVARPTADHGLDELADRRPRLARTKQPEAVSKLIPDPQHVFISAESECQLHVAFLRTNKEHCKP